MDFKRIFKTPLFWVLAVIVVMLTVFSFDGNGGYTTVTTAQAEKLITDKKVETAVLSTDNTLSLDLKQGQTFSDSASDISGATFTQVTAANNVQVICFDRTKRYVRYVGTIGGSSTPTVLAAVFVGEQKKQV